MARIIDESFEGTGYEESWTETIDTGCTLDKDASIPGTPPPGSGSQNLKSIVVDNTNNNAYADQLKTNQNISFVRAYVYLSQVGFGNNQGFQGLSILDSSNNPAGRIQIALISGVGKIRFQYYSNGVMQSTSFINLTINTWYRIEYQYDITNMLWGWKIDGVSKANGSLVSATRTPQKMRVGITSHTGTNNTTLYTDLVVWDNADWVGAQFPHSQGIIIG